MSTVKRIWRLLLAVWKTAGDKHLGLIAAGVAFFGMFGIFPAIAAVIAIFGLVADPAVIAEQLQIAGGNADRLVSIIKENGELQKKVKRNLEASVMQSLLDIVLVSDMNEDFSLTAKELRRLETRFNAIPGIQFDKKNWKAFVGGKSELNMADIMKLIHNLRDNIPEKQNIFHLRPDKIK